MEDGIGTANSEVFALTDEQIVGLTPGVASEREKRNAEGAEEEAHPSRNALRAGRTQREGGDTGIEEGSLHSEPHNARRSGRDDSLAHAGEAGRSKDRPLHGDEGRGVREDRLVQPGMAVPREAPRWLAERMDDPWCGEEAKEFWEGKQRAESEAAEYREVFGSSEDARALKEIYPGGVSEARLAAERARALDEIDAAFYRGDAAARMQLAQRMMAQDAGAFREMVAAGLRLLNAEGNTNAEGAQLAQRDRSGAGIEERSLHPASQNQQGSGRDDSGLNGGARESAQTGVPVPREVVAAYGEFEKSANAELEKSVGGAIERAMDAALPNLRFVGRTIPGQRGSGQAGAQGTGGAAPLQDRLAGAVREEVEAGLKSDRALGEQVARVLAGRRFDGEARAQVVRLIDARAQQLVPGAVRRVVSSWTNAALAARAKGTVSRSAEPSRVAEAKKTLELPVARRGTAKEEAARMLEEVPARRGRRVDYGRWSDEEIVGM